jgi:stage V sporulation protein G
MTDHCDKCGGKNHLRAKFCNNCGVKLKDNRARKDVKGRMKLHADIAHPINAECRQRIQEKVTAAFKAEVEKSKKTDYKPVESDEAVNEAVNEAVDEADDDVPEIIS